MERETRSKDMEVHVEGDSQQDANTQTSWLADGIYFINNNDIEVTEVAMLLPGILGILEVGSATFVHLTHSLHHLMASNMETDLRFLSDSPKYLLTISGPLIS